MRNVPSLEAVERDYADQGVDFYYIYKSLAHPEQNGYVTPFTLEERLLHIAEAKKKLGTRLAWICDSMSNDLKHALGNAPNSEFIVDPNGKIVRARRWSNPRDLRQDLETLVGKVDNPTRAADLAIGRIRSPQTAATGIVDRVELPGRMTPVTVVPIRKKSSGKNEVPFYVKLRAEMESQFFETGTGQLYLGFFLDPLYKVHWNNRAASIQFEIQATADISCTPSRGQGPSVKADADADPREFLVEVCDFFVEDADLPAAKILLTVKYVACDDAETFCKPVTQQYEIIFERDRDGGSRRGGSRRGGGRFGRRGF